MTTRASNFDLLSPREAPSFAIPLAHHMGEGGHRPGEGFHFSSQLSAFSFSRVALPIAGFQHYDGAAVLTDLRPGTALNLRAQPDNPHDPFAVEILHGRTKLGYVPRFCNRQLSQLLDSDDPPTCEVAHVSADSPPWEAVAVRISVNQPEFQSA